MACNGRITTQVQDGNGDLNRGELDAFLKGRYRIRRPTEGLAGHVARRLRLEGFIGVV